MAVPKTVKASLSGPVSPRGATPFLAAAVALAGLGAGTALGYSTVMLAVALGGPALISLARRPQMGVFVLAAAAPFDGLLQLAPHASSLRAWKEVLTGAVLLASFVCPAEVRVGRRRLPPWTTAVAALMGLGLISAAFVGGSQAITGFRIDYFYVLLAWAMWRCPLRDGDRDRLVSILMVTGGLEAAIGLAEQGIGGGRLHGLGFPYNTTIRFAGSHLRSFGTFTYQAPLAYFLVVVALIGLSQLLSDPGRRRNRLFGWTLPVIGAALFFTFERGAWIAMIVGCLYLGVRRHRVLLLAAPPVLVAVLYLPGRYLATAVSSSSLGERASGWSANLGNVLAHPLGQGIGATGAAAARVAALDAKSGSTLAGAGVYQPDNYYYKTVYELGVLGLWLLLLFLVGAVVWCHRVAAELAARQAPARDEALVEAVCAFLLAAMAASGVATFFEIFPMDLLTWMLLGTVASCQVE